MIEYAQAINASAEVVNWCNTVLAATAKKEVLKQDVVEHVIDYLASDAAPKRLRRMSFEQARISADKWTKAQQKKGRNLVDGPEDIESLHEFGDGTKIVKLLTKKAYQREGFFMAHCVGGYNPDSATIYSYRDEKNEPHATFEVTGGDQITQIKGKGNGPIHPRYIDPILIFLKKIGMDIRPSDMKNLGYYHVTKEWKEVLDMFVDTRGKGPEYVEISGEEYIYA